MSTRLLFFNVWIECNKFKRAVNQVHDQKIFISLVINGDCFLPLKKIKIKKNMKPWF